MQELTETLSSQGEPCKRSYLCLLLKFVYFGIEKLAEFNHYYLLKFYSIKYKGLGADILIWELDVNLRILTLY